MESNHSIASDFASFTKHLTIRRLRISLTAFGRTLPFFLDRALSDALQRFFETNEGNIPRLPVLTNLVVDLRSNSDWSGAVHSSACNRCSGCILGGPVAVYLLQVFNCSKTMLLLNWYALDATLSGWSKAGEASLGYSSSSAFRVALLLGASPSDDRIFASRPNWSCKHKLLALLASSSILFVEFYFASVKKFAYSPLFNWSMQSESRWSWFRLCFLPPRMLARRMHFEAEHSFCQFSSSSGVLAQSSRMLVSSCDLLTLNLTGTKRHVGTCELTIVCIQGSFFIFFCFVSSTFSMKLAGFAGFAHQAGFAHRMRGVGQYYPKLLLLYFCDSSNYVCASNRTKLISHWITSTSMSCNHYI